MGVLMELDDAYQPFLDFMHKHQFSTLLLQGPVDEESNEVMFYFPNNIHADMGEHRLYVEFNVPNVVINEVIQNQKQLQEICAAFN
jgi:hypothetical protein